MIENARPIFADPDNPTVEELLAISDGDFRAEATEDLEYTGAHSSPFQDPQVIRRTLTSLIDSLWFVDASVRKQAVDPRVDATKYERTLAFRRHLLSVIDITERRAEWAAGPTARQISAWKQLLHDLLDALDGGPEEWVLDDLKIPFDNLTLRAWREIRRVKDPRRVPAKEVAA